MGRYMHYTYQCDNIEKPQVKTKFKLGDIVSVVDAGYCYPYYKAALDTLGVFNRQKICTNYDYGHKTLRTPYNPKRLHWIVLGIVLHADTRHILYLLCNRKNELLLIGEEGISLINSMAIPFSDYSTYIVKYVK